MIPHSAPILLFSVMTGLRPTQEHTLTRALAMLRLGTHRSQWLPLLVLKCAWISAGTHHVLNSSGRPQL